MPALQTASNRMDRIYRWQRHIYDATRRHFLLGRDTLIAGLLPPDGGTVVEVGCGTARNLIAAAQAYPTAQFYGIDVSAMMLKTAAAKIAAAGLDSRIRVAQGDATNFDVRQLFDIAAADRIVVSYALSMIPQWRQVLECASGQLAERGAVHVVDFGQLDAWPRLVKTGLDAWLARFEVHPSAELPSELERIARMRGLDFFIAHPHGGYATYAILRRI